MTPSPAAPSPDVPPRPALTVEDLGFSYGEAAVLAGVSFEAPSGAVTAILGPSGCGKSTLLSLVGGLLSPDRGDIRRGFRRPAFMFQDPALLPWRSARDNVAFALKALPLDRAWREKRADAMLAAVGLAPADAGKVPRQLSGGMRRRVALARALVVEPDVLLLDEPFGGLDVGLARQMAALVRRIVDRRGLSALMVTHDLADAARMAERIVVLSPAPGRVAAVHDLPGPPAARDAAAVNAAIDRLLADPVIAAILTPAG